MSAWIIGGASRGIGAALFETLAPSGPALGLARQSVAFEELRARTENLPQAKLAALDLRDAQATNQAVDGFLTSPESGVVVINCAATWTGGKDTLELTAEDFIHSLSLNFLPAVNLSQSVLKRWDAAGRNYPLTIINLGATASTRGGRKTSAFAVAKSALRIYSQSMAREFGPAGVHVAHIVIDGLIDNPRTRDLNAGRQDDK